MAFKSLSNSRKFLYYVAVVFVFLSSCSKDTVKPETDEKDTDIHKYEVQKLTYFLAENDKIDTVRVGFAAEEFSNPSAALINVQHKEIFEDLIKTSVFQFDKNGKELPKDFEKAYLEVSIPEIYYGDGRFSYYEDQFSLTDSLLTKPYNHRMSYTMGLNIPAKSKLILEKTIDKYTMTCSFELIARNKNTGQLFTLNGKWKGVLRYTNESFKVSQKDLD
ncbi:MULTISPECIES: hypothetical protein [unclassified Sphingobacterium]|uniref:hypothetical protein n=1 Tax=unclassified Sphingobacterium TaxID=2609468 RepID=UPI0025CD01A9|nr:MULTISPECIES: hypothetical protein [unclassified Sphingobacterium]